MSTQPSKTDAETEIVSDLAWSLNWMIKVIENDGIPRWNTGLINMVERAKGHLAAYEEFVMSKVRNADLYLCREVQRKNEFPHHFDLQEECENKYGWMPQYAKEIVEEVWTDLYGSYNR